MTPLPQTMHYFQWKSLRITTDLHSLIHSLAMGFRKMIPIPKELMSRLFFKKDGPTGGSITRPNNPLGIFSGSKEVRFQKKHTPTHTNDSKSKTAAPGMYQPVSVMLWVRYGYIDM